MGSAGFENHFGVRGYAISKRFSVMTLQSGRALDVVGGN